MTISRMLARLGSVALILLIFGGAARAQPCPTDPWNFQLGTGPCQLLHGGLLGQPNGAAALDSSGHVAAGELTSSVLSTVLGNGKPALNFVPRAPTGNIADDDAINIGPWAGYSTPNPTGGFGQVAIGPYALMMETAGGNESVAIGSGACAQQVGQFGNTCIGESNLNTDPAASYFTGIGNDLARDATGVSTSTAVGAQVLDDGAYGGPNTVFGTFALHGSAGTVQIGSGSVTTGDVYAITISSTSGQTTGAPATVRYTAKAGDNSASVAQGLAAALSGTAISYAQTTPAGLTITSSPSGQTSYDMAGDNYVSLHMPTSAALSMSGSCTGTCGATITVLAATASSSNDVFGFKALYGAALTTGTDNAVFGDYAASMVYGPFAQNAIFGVQAYESATTANNNTVIGALAGYNTTGAYENVLLGYHAGFDNQGNQNILIGAEDGSEGCASSSGYININIGYNTCLPSTGGNFQIVIGDTFYATGANPLDHSGGTGASAGVNTASPTFSWTVGDGVGHGNQHWGVQQTTKLSSGSISCTGGTGTLDAYSQDGALQLTGASGITACTITMAKAYSHPIWFVYSPNGGPEPTTTLSGATLTMSWGAALTGASVYNVMIEDRS